MAHKKPVNPFYVALLPVGVIFAVTACAFVVMMVQRSEAQQLGSTRLVGLMARHGIAIMIAELAALAVLTIAAISSDDYWVRRFEAAQSREPRVENPR